MKPLKNMTVKESMTSKAMLAGYALCLFGGYLAIMEKQFEYGGAMVLNGLGLLGLRDRLGG